MFYHVVGACCYVWRSLKPFSSALSQYNLFCLLCIAILFAQLQPLSNVLALVGEPLEPLFRLSDQSCLTYTVFLNAFRFISQLMRLDQSSYGGHSFRRGAATWGSKVGLSNSEIKLLGYWSSDCFSRYVDSDVDQRLKAISTFSSL